MKYIGNPSCRNNAMHPALRCAINPQGPCKGCPDFVGVTFGERWRRNRSKAKAFARGFGLGLLSAIAVGVPSLVAMWIVVNWPIVQVQKK